MVDRPNTPPEKKAEPLTEAQLQKMNGKPVWADSKYYKGWALVSYGGPEYGFIAILTASEETYYIYTSEGAYNKAIHAKCYLHPPEGEGEEELTPKAPQEPEPEEPHTCRECDYFGCRCDHPDVPKEEAERKVRDDRACRMFTPMP